MTWSDPGDYILYDVCRGIDLRREDESEVMGEGETRGTREGSKLNKKKERKSVKVREREWKKNEKERERERLR